jgi:hypothetical protein
VAIEPSGLRNSTRPLIESATARTPLASAASPSGALNWPGPRPETPHERSSLPLRSNTSIRSLPVLVT